MEQGFTIWFTGLSGAGKTTLAQLVECALRGRGYKVEVLDGDMVRTNLSKGLGYSQEDRDTNIRRIGFVCNLLTRNGVGRYRRCNFSVPEDQRRESSYNRSLC